MVQSNLKHISHEVNCPWDIESCAIKRFSMQLLRLFVLSIEHSQQMAF